MTVGIKLGSITDEVGSASFLGAFFDTISGNLESRNRGSRFPKICSELFSGELAAEGADEALAELQAIEAELSHLSPKKVIWSLERPSEDPPWGTSFAPNITDLSNYFVTSTGRDLIGVIREILTEQCQQGGTAKIVTY